MSQNKHKSDEQEAANKWRELAEEEARQSAEEPDAKDASDVVDSEEVVGALDEVSKKKLTDLTNILEREIDKYKSEALRAQAEMENLRRRLERDVSNAHKYGSERLLVDLLPVIDSLVRGLEESKSDDPSVQSLRTGMELTLDILHNTLKKHGVEEINPVRGDAFNPELHEAMSMQKDPESEPNTILHVLQRGYCLNGRVVRAAMVMVAS